MTNAVLAFSPEAFDTAADHFRKIEGYSVDVMIKDGREFDAEVVGIRTNESSGQYELGLAPWDQEKGEGDRSRVEWRDLYDDLASVTVR